MELHPMCSQVPLQLIWIRCKLKDDLVARNLRFLHKHYVALAKHETDESLHKMLELDVKFLPPIVDEGNGKGEVDAGQNDHLLEF
jgi:hypothetical protein